MTDKNYTSITLVLDRSGSMEKIKNDTVGALTNFIREQKKFDYDNDLKTDITFIEFDDEYKIICRGENLKDFSLPEFRPRGWTALFDAVGRAIVDTGSRLDGMPSNRRPSKVLFVILTDGEENSSKEYKRHQIADMIKHQREKYSWEFMYLGVGVDAFKTAQTINIPTWTTMNIGANSLGLASASSSLSAVVGNYKIGATTGASFTQSDYAAQAKAGADNSKATSST